jgi:heme exporter protein D
MMIDTLLDMTIGMALGMVASPIMMKAIKILRQRRKVDKILREISEDQQHHKELQKSL